MRPFHQIDVFTDQAGLGNPVAVVHDADGLDDDELQAFAAWTNLSETTFLYPPSDPAADYRVRIFTPTVELPFAGHPTLGSARAWLAGGGTPATSGVIVQECGIGLVELREKDGRLAFAAPGLRRSGDATPAEVAHALEPFGLTADDIVDAAWADNGPGWLAVRMPSVEALRAVAVVEHRDDVDLGLYALTGAEPALEVRAFFSAADGVREDPVTGSLNAALAQLLVGSGALEAPYVASQGRALGRDGRVHVETDGDRRWIGGDTVVVVAGEVDYGRSPTA